MAPAAISSAPIKYAAPENVIGMSSASAPNKHTGKISIMPAMAIRRRKIIASIRNKFPHTAATKQLPLQEV
jgi:hypothetical protein